MLESPYSPSPEAFSKALQAYLATTLRVPLSLEEWDGRRSLPIFLSRRYRFYETRIAGRACLFMATPDLSDTTPDEIGKNVRAVASVFGGLVVFTTPQMPASIRARLIAQGTAFVVPGNQLYIPEMAMDLRDHFRRPPQTRDKLSPVAQVVLFQHALARDSELRRTPTELAGVLPYTAMSLGRAFDELSLRNLATITRTGREKTISFNAAPRTLIDMSKTLLRRPARGIHSVTFNGPLPPMMIAGESALAELTELAPPRRPVFAIEASGWGEFFERHAITDHHYDFEGEAIIETWHYDPHILSERSTVDELSLYAQFWDSADERIARFASDLLERIE